MITPSYAPTATERVLPRLALDFTTGVLDPRVTVARALNTATRVNSSGFVEVVNANLPRFDYDPVTLAPKGLLVEEQRTNLLTYSEQFDNAAWTKFQASASANTTTSPDGTADADSLIEDSSAGTHVAFQNYTTSSAVTYTFSVFAKANARSRIQLLMSDTAANNVNALFNLSAGTVTATNNVGTGSGAAATITSFGNGWYRCTLSGIPAAALATLRSHVYLLDNSGNQSYTGDGTSGIFIWGAQLEAGSFATSYIPTTAASLTRNADVVTMTGTNFTSWYNTSEGAVFSEVTLSNLTKSQGAWAIGDSSLGFGSGRMMYAESSPGASGKLTFNVFNNGAQQVFIQPNVTPVAGTPIRSVFAYKASSYTAAVSASSTSTVGGSLPSVTSMSIGSLASGWSGATQYMNGHVRKIFYWPQRLINAEVQAFSK